MASATLIPRSPCSASRPFSPRGASTRALPLLSRRASSRTTCCSAESPKVYQGAYGEFSIGPEDEKEVFLYRLGINVAAAAAVSSGLVGLLPGDNALHVALLPYLDVITLAGAAGLGVSLQQIHIYVDPLKKALQLLWALGLAGAVGIMVAQEDPAAVFVAAHPVATWLVGPMFAALTGVAFKEGFCYGKWEAAGLFGTTPLFLLGHLFHVLPEEGERGMMVAFCTLISVFALRKWTQATKDDVGDKSVFMMLAMSPEEQEQKMALRARAAQAASLQQADDA